MQAGHEQTWVHWAFQQIKADCARSANTYLLPAPLPALPRTAIYPKHESSRPPGSFKHRLARVPFPHPLCSGWTGPETTAVEALGGRCQPGKAPGPVQALAARLTAELASRGEDGAIVSILCDRGERYAAALCDDDGLAAQGLDVSAEQARRACFPDAGSWCA
jgi:hypothetical protein